MSLASEIIGSFVGSGAGMHTVRRGAAPTLAKGVATAGAETVLEVLAAILPAAHTDLARTIEGERLTGLVAIYSADPLFAARETGEPADLVEWQGSTYEVEDVDPFEGGLYIATARRKVAA